ncbi:MAG: dTDP-4-dehydrorhamnose reductase [Sphingobium sp.]
MKALITGARGQVGRALVATRPREVDLACHGSDTLDITDAGQVAAVIRRERPALIINAAAYTLVDRAEREEARAHAVNARAVGVLAAAASQAGARLVHLSSDFVFDGGSGTPYAPTAPAAPLGAYGRSKLAGEVLAGDDALIVRTAWVHAARGANFVRTMIGAMAGASAVRVVVDQIGTPTHAPHLAEAVWDLALQRRRGVYHVTDSGVASWYDFAVAIQEDARAIGLLSHAVPIVPVATADFPTAAPRPPYSVLDKAATIAALGRTAPHWRANLRRMLQEMKDYG